MTLSDFIQGLSTRHDLGITYIKNADDEYFTSYAALYERALCALHNLTTRGIKPDDELVLQIEDNETFMTIFWACLLGKIVPVPVSIAGLPEYKLKLIRILQQLKRPRLLISAEHLSQLEAYGNETGYSDDLTEIVSNAVSIGEMLVQQTKGKALPSAPQDIAFIQFSSGSTGDPKGVVLTHHNLVTNIKDIIKRSRITGADAMLSWMPLTHDMGLIGVPLTAAVAQLNVHLMPPGLFIKKPLLWMEKVARHKATLSYSPNFGYQYFLAAYQSATSVPVWQLSHLRIIYNGAEPISAALCHNFVNALLRHGLRHSVIMPAYGMAEASVAVALPDPGEQIVSHVLHRAHLKIGDKVRHVDHAEQNDGVTFVEVGYALDNCRIRVCDDNAAVLPEGAMGHIQIQGDNVTTGYYQREAANRHLYSADGWLDTGDLGFIVNNRLTISGRAKNLIVINGFNYYPQDIERLVCAGAEIEQGKVVACGIADSLTGSEELVIFIQFKGPLEEFLPVYQTTKETLANAIGLSVDNILPVQRIPRTTSGKIQHYKLAEAWKKDTYRQQAEKIRGLLDLHTTSTGISQTEMIATLAAITKEVLGVGILDPRDDFFTLGMNSMKALRIIGRINQALGRGISTEAFFNNTTLEKLTREILRNSDIHTVPQEAAPVPRVTDNRLSASQRRLWVIEQFEKVGSAYHISVAIHVKGNIDAAALQHAFFIVGHRHESIRTNFILKGNDLEQYVRPYANDDFKIGHINLEHDIDREATAITIARREANTPFDLQKDPLLRVKLIGITPRRAVLVMTLHHIIADGWSIKVLLKEISEAYESYLRGTPAQLPQLQIQLRNFTAWQNEQIKHPQYDTDKAYWLGQFSKGVPAPVLRETGTAGKPTFQTFRGANYSLNWGPETALLRQFSMEHGATLFTTLLAMLYGALYTEGGQHDIVIGTDAAGRVRPEFEDQIGYYLNTLPLRLTVSEDENFIALMSRVKSKLIAALDHQRYSFEQLIEDLKLARDGAGTPLFNVLVVFQNYEAAHYLEALKKSLDVSITPLQLDSSLIDLQLEFEERQDELVLNVRFNPDVIHESRVRQLTRRLQDLCRGIIAHPLKSLGEHVQTRQRPNQDGSAGNNEVRSVTTLIESRAAATPAAVAVRDDTKALTYEALNQSANRLAHYLRSEGIGQGHRVGLLLERSAEMIVAILAVLKTGAAYVPLDGEHPANRLRYMLKESKAGWLMTDAATHRGTSLTDSLDSEVTLLNLPSLNTGSFPQTDPAATVDPESLAYIMFTSGSTGTPKGVMISNGALLDYTQTFKHYFDLTERDVVIQQSLLSFDTSIEEIFPVLSASGTLLVLREGARNITQLLRALVDTRATVLSTTPLVLKELNPFAGQLTGLRAIISGGDRLKANYVEHIVGNVPLYNTYGPTEATVCATYHRVEALSDVAIIGKPIANRTVYVLDEDLALRNIGEVGEIYIGGAGLALGYVNQPGLTAQSFIDSPFEPNTRLYKTGDLGRWLPDGNLEYIGRKDDQIKIRGHRVEVGELEQVLMKHPQVGDALVICMKDQEDVYLNAIYTGSMPIQPQLLVKYLEEHLPPYMLPRHLEYLEAFPLLPNGKVDRQALVDRQEAILRTGPVYTAPGSPTEKKLVSIWAEVLENSRIGVMDNFFDLGGQSIKATRIAYKINDAFGIKVELRNIFVYPTVRSLAQVIDKIQQEQGVKIMRVPEKPDYDLSPAQKRLWILHQLSVQQTAYNIAGAFLIKGKLDVQVFEKAVKVLVDRHESLRTVFTRVEGEPRQRIISADAFTLPIIYKDLETQSFSAGDEARYISTELNTSFDLENGPLFYIKLFRINQRRYVLGFCMHHIVSDGWSMEVMAGEFVTLYSQFKSGVDRALPPFTIQYKDFAAWQNDKITQDGFRTDLDYWLTCFNNETPVLNFPVDRPRPAVKTYNGATVADRKTVLPYAGVKAFARQREATPFMVLAASLYALLYTYTGQHDIVVGTPVSGREDSNLEHQIGLYINTLALRVGFQPTDTLNTLLDKVRETTLGAFAHQACPFDQLVERLSPSPDLSRSPLFDVMLVLHNIELGGPQLNALDGLTSTRYALAENTSKFDLTFTFHESPRELGLTINYNTDLFLPETPRRIHAMYVALLKAMLSNPDMAIDELDYLSRQEKNHLLGQFIKTKVAFPLKGGVADAFEQRAARNPDAVAVVYGHDVLTCRQLNERANEIAHHIAARYGIKAGDRVAVRMAQTGSMPVVLLGILKLGAAYVPVDPYLPEVRVRHIFKNSAPRLVITDYQEATPPVPALATFDITVDNAFLLSQRTDNPSVIRRGGDTAYVIYTSGSTGAPKGVQVSNANLLNYIQWFAISHNIVEADSTLLVSSISFDLSYTSLWPALVNGCALHLMKDSRVFEPTAIVEYIAACKITFLKLTPSHLAMILNSPRFSAAIEECVLRLVVLGGEEINTRDVAKFLFIKNDVLFVNHYGPTETTIGTITHPVLHESFEAFQAQPVLGKPIANARIFIMRNGRNLLPIGAIGEICIGGHGVAKGYLDQPELTAQKFIAEPWRKQGRLYRSGDLGKWTAEGTIQFLGRADFQVKIRGYRIELGEIENTLLKHPQVQKALVVTRPANGSNDLVAYFSGNSSASAADIKAFLKNHLPEYMIPGHLMYLPVFPLTPNGKVDRQSLPEPTYETESSPHLPSANPVETGVAHIWQSVLKRDRIGMLDNFFHIGGHSLKAAQVMFQVSQVFNVQVSLLDVFNHPTVRSLADMIIAAKKEATDPILPIAERKDYDLSYAQQRLWVLSQFEKAQEAYHMPAAYLLEGEVSIDTFQEAFNAILARHESLRTTFFTIDGAPKQKIHSPGTFSSIVRYQDLTAHQDQDTVMRSLMTDQTHAPFDLERGPLVRALLLQLNTQRYMFILVLHHIISDGWSMKILEHELSIYYNSIRKGEVDPLAPLKIQYKDYSAWQRKQLDDQVTQEHRRYWLDRFNGPVPILNLPTDYPRPVRKTFNGRAVYFNLGEHIGKKLEEKRQAHGATLFMALIASVKGLLFRYTDQMDIVVGVPTSGREHADLENQVGFYVNTLPLRTRFDRGCSFEDLLELVKSGLLQAYEHQNFPLDWIINGLNLERDMGRSPLFDVVVQLQNTELDSPAQTLDGMTTQEYTLDWDTSKFDLTFNFIESHGTLACKLDYNRDLFSHAWAERFVAHYQHLMEALLTESDTPICKLDWIAPKEKLQVLDEFNASSLAYDDKKTLVELFEQQVAIAPDAVAVYCEGTQLSYRELNEVSNRLAHHLRGQCHIGPGSLVAFMLDKSEWSVIAILAILKAGGAYVPIDPTYPPARISYILDDTATAVLLTQSDYLMQITGFTGTLFAMDIELLMLSNPTDDLDEVNTPEDLAYVIYTSGSTGNPKGVMIPHGAVVNLVAGLGHIVYNHHPGPLKIALVASLVFDPSVQQIFAALLKGHALYIIPDEIKKSGDKLWRYYRHHRINVTDGTPALLSILENARPELMGDLSLTHLIIGGDVLPVPLVKQFYDQPDVKFQIVNIYGPTEACVDITAFTIHPEDTQTLATIPIGKPMANRKLYILDKEGQPQPIGVYGEIYVGGTGLAHGYLRRQDLTGQKFIASPFGAPGHRLYSTGDRGRWLSDGVIEFGGRLDEQLKIRGYRIEPAEIELALCQHPAVSQAVVVGHGSNGTTSLAAYFMSIEPLSAASLRSFLQNKLPDYMIPGYLIPLPRLPLTVNGKIDKNALPDPGESLEQEEWQAPQTPAEVLLASLWQQVLDRERIGTNDNFFLLGGDSIKAIQVASRMHTAGYKLEVKDIFQHSTIRELAGVVMAQQQADQSSVEGPVPLTPIQKAFFAQHFTEPHYYNQAIMLEFFARVEAASLREAFTRILLHHDALRMRYQSVGENVSQHNTAPGEPVWLEVHDFRHAADAAYGQHYINQVQASLDLEQGPLLKIALLQLPQADYVLIVIHHLVVDGVSWRILLEDLSSLLDQFGQTHAASLPAKSSSYRQWAVTLQELAANDAFGHQRAYWQQVEQQALIQYRSRPVSARAPEPVADPETRFELTASQTEELLRQVPAAFNTEINDVLLAALSRAFGQVLGWQHVVIALEGHGREFISAEVDVARTVGWFTSVYPVILSGSTHQDLGRHLQETKEHLRAIPDKGIGYGVLKYLTAGETPPESLPVDLCFNYLGQFDTDTSTRHFRIAPEPAGKPISDKNRPLYKITVTGLIIQGRLRVTMTHQAEHNSAHTMQQVSNAYHQALVDMIGYCCSQLVSQKTPSDFTYKELSLDELDSIMSAYK